MTRETAGVRQRTNVTLPEALLCEARQLNINLSQACERGLTVAVSEMKAAMDAWNAHVEEKGLPLAEYSQF